MVTKRAFAPTLLSRGRRGLKANATTAASMPRYLAALTMCGYRHMSASHDLRAHCDGGQA